MKIRQPYTTETDRLSAKIFFDALFSFWDVQEGDALDMFARDGALTVSQYAYKVTNLDLWELNEVHRKKLSEFRPREIVIGDSYKTLAACKKQYDLVVVDSPQGIHTGGPAGEPNAEHFTVMQTIAPILKDNAIIVLYVNKRPYDKGVEGEHGYDAYEEYDFKSWMKHRQAFYETSSNNITEAIALNAYADVLFEQNFAVNQTMIVPCYSDVPGREPYAFRLALSVSRVP